MPVENSHPERNLDTMYRHYQNDEPQWLKTTTQRI